MYIQNLLCKPLQGEHLKYKSANGEVGARLVLLHRISGEKTTKLPTLMSEYSTHLLNLMPIPPYQNAIENMNWIRRGNMMNE